MTRRLAGLMVAVWVVALFVPAEAAACPICFGDPESPVAQGMNWAVFMLLGVTGGVLSGFVGFIFHLMKRSRQALGHEDDRSGPTRAREGGM